MSRLTEKQIKTIKEKIPVYNKNFIVRLSFSDLKNTTEHELNHNVYCIDEQYNIIWQVQREDIEKRYVANRLKMSSPVSVASLNLTRRDYLAGITITGGELFAVSFRGFEYRINIENGESKLIGWSK